MRPEHIGWIYWSFLLRAQSTIVIINSFILGLVWSGFLFPVYYRPWTRRLMPTPSTSSSNQPSYCVCTQNVSVWRDHRMTDLSSFASNTSWFPSEWHQQGIRGAFQKCMKWALKSYTSLELQFLIKMISFKVRVAYPLKFHTKYLIHE